MTPANGPESIDPVDPRQRQQAKLLGLCLGVACLALITACIIIFSTIGLPKDPKEWKRLQQQEADKEALGADIAPQKDESK
jgi:hypothetical protein